ncbi:probable folate-biopterin transporter 9, chloroplastic [Aristolochia californica]|uniref:probable folate-biopterin transporter 9, chloroplastic n=1 Tax=Aristolochia californica TaxID=171875 RepID=UPI0035DC7DB8
MITYVKTSPETVPLFIEGNRKIKRLPSPLWSLICNSRRNPEISSPSSSISVKRIAHLFKKPVINPNQRPTPLKGQPHKNNESSSNSHFGRADSRQMFLLCGFGYWVQGFRCFPWLALNFYMAQGLNLQPSTLQLVQYSANLPMVAKPLYGVLSDALYVGEAHRLPYISMGVFMQLLSWSTMAAIPVGGTFPTQMACILLSNLGASITEVASDALVAEFGKKNGIGELQSYAFMALAIGGILGNLSGGFFLLKTQPKIMFLVFSALLSSQLTSSLATKESSLCLSEPSGHQIIKKSISENLSQQFSDLVTAISKDTISHPLYWIVASIAVVPILSGTTFCYQTQCLKLDSSIIGMSKVIGQLMLLSATICYNRYLNKIPMRKLISWIQITYAFSILSDWFLVKQFNVQLGISNESYVLFVSSLAEAVAQFKLLPFSILFAKLSPPGNEGSLIAFLASALCLASIIGCFLGVGLASLVGISSEDYSNLPVGILFQFLAALLPLGWISYIPMSQTAAGEKKRSKRRRLPLPDYQENMVKKKEML